MFKIGLSREINKDSFNCNLNGLLSFKNIVIVYRILYFLQYWLCRHSNDCIVINFQVLTIFSWFYLIKYDGFIDSVSRSYAVRREDSNDFIMIQMCSWKQNLLYFYFWCVFVFQDTCHKRYGDVICRKVREFEKVHFKYRKVLLDTDFVNTCLKNNIKPKFL